MADVPLIWQLGKLLASIGLVLGLGLVAVRVSPRVAGLLAVTRWVRRWRCFSSAWKSPPILRRKAPSIPWQVLLQHWH